MSNDHNEKARKVFEAFESVYSKPLPLCRVLFCSHESNIKYYQRELNKLMSELGRRQKRLDKLQDT